MTLSAVRTWLSTQTDGGIEDIIFVLRGTTVMAAFRGVLDRQLDQPLDQQPRR